MSSRLEKIADLFKKEIADILLKKANDHRIGFVSITDVEVSPDLSSAKVYVSCLGSAEEKKRSMRGLRSASPFIRSSIAKVVNLKFMPQLKFIQDESLERGAHVIDILNKLKVEREAQESDRS